MNGEPSRVPVDMNYAPEGQSDPQVAWGRCAIEAHSYSAENGWGLIRLTGLTYPGREHWGSLRVLNEESMDCEVRDGTLRQFSPQAPQLFVGPLDDWLDDCVELMRDHLRYEMFTSLGEPEPFYADHWIREDITPGNSLPHPWTGDQVS